MYDEFELHLAALNRAAYQEMNNRMIYRRLVKAIKIKDVEHPYKDVLQTEFKHIAIVYHGLSERDSVRLFWKMRKLFSTSGFFYKPQNYRLLFEQYSQFTIRRFIIKQRAANTLRKLKYRKRRL
jgi:hypothetical protein